MKKILSLFFCLLCLSAVAQDFPYQKLLNYAHQDFENAKFKYDSYYNQWDLNRANGWNVASNVLSALADESADSRPASDDYHITVQLGDNEQIANIYVTFYQTSTYHDILTFANDHGSNLLETNSSKTSKIQFNYDAYKFTIERIEIQESTTVTNTSATAKSKDTSYDKYVYIIETDISPSSPYKTRQMEKQQKRDDKGKKQNNVNNFY